MKKRSLKYIALALAVIVAVGGFAGCSTQPSGTTEESANVGNASEPENVDNESAGNELPEYDSEVLTVADFISPYNTVDCLNEEATLVVEGVVKSKTVHLHEVNDEAVPYTLFEIEVTKVVKGEAKSGSVLLVAEYGGILTAAQAGLCKKFPDMTKEDAQKKVFISFGDDPVEVDQQLLLFLSNEPGYQILKVDSPYYMLVGEYNGKFVHDSGDSYIQSLPADSGESADPIIIDDDLSVFD